VPTIEARCESSIQLPSGVEYHRNPRGCAERDWRPRFAASDREDRGMDLVHFEHLKRDVAPPFAADTGVDAGVAILLQHDQRLAGAERGAG
jgi:hypothetical protein